MMKLNYDFLKDGYYTINPPGKLEMIDILVWYDGPQIAIFKHKDNYKLFGIASDECREEKETMWLMKCVKNDEIEQIKNKQISLYDVYNNGAIIGFEKWNPESFEIYRAYYVSRDKLTNDMLPEKGCFLP